MSHVKANAIQCTSTLFLKVIHSASDIFIKQKSCIMIFYVTILKVGLWTLHMLLSFDKIKVVLFTARLLLEPKYFAFLFTLLESCPAQ